MGQLRSKVFAFCRRRHFGFTAFSTAPTFSLSGFRWHGFGATNWDLKSGHDCWAGCTSISCGCDGLLASCVCPISGLNWVSLRYASLRIRLASGSLYVDGHPSAIWWVSGHAICIIGSIGRWSIGKCASMDWASLCGLSVLIGRCGSSYYPDRGSCTRYRFSATRIATQSSGTHVRDAPTRNDCEFVYLWNGPWGIYTRALNSSDSGMRNHHHDFECDCALETRNAWSQQTLSKFRSTDL